MDPSTEQTTNILAELKISYGDDAESEKEEDSHKEIGKEEKEKEEENVVIPA